jgi:hypothetical protein
VGREWRIKGKMLTYTLYLNHEPMKYNLSNIMGPLTKVPLPE